MKSTFDLKLPPHELSPDLMMTMVISLWKQLLAHDEIVNARNLLNAVPWQIRHRQEIRDMRSIVDGMLTHVDNPEVMREIYSSYGANESLSVTAAIPINWSQYPRWEFALSHTKQLCDNKADSRSEVNVLDIATSDGWIANRLGMMTSAYAYGLDLSAASIAVARMRASEHNTRARYAQMAFGHDALPSDWPQKFDLILMFEVYEHVACTKTLMQSAAKLLAPGGLLLISAPRGAWCMGVQVSYHEKWDEQKPREHIRAPILDDIYNDCVAVGLQPIKAVEKPMEMPDVPGQATILVAAQMPVSGA